MKQPANSELSHSLLLQVLDKIHHPVLILNSDNLILYLNEAMLHYVEKVTSKSWKREQVVGMDVISFHPPRSQKGMKERIETVLSGKPLSPRFNTVDETMFMTYETALKDESGNTVGLMMGKIPVCIVSEKSS